MTLTIIDEYVFDATYQVLSPHRTPKDIKCRECGQPDMPVIVELIQLAFDGHKSTVYVYCEKCDRWYYTSQFIKYEEDK